jgi:hypothetical protein
MFIGSISADEEHERILDRINTLITPEATRPTVANVYNSYFERVGTLATCSILDLMECVFLKWSHASGFNGKITLLHWENRKRKSKFQQVNSDHCAEQMGTEWEGEEKKEKKEGKESHPRNTERCLYVFWWIVTLTYSECVNCKKSLRRLLRSWRKRISLWTTHCKTPAF